MPSSKPDVSEDVHGNSLPDNGSRRKEGRRHKAKPNQMPQNTTLSATSVATTQGLTSINGPPEGVLEYTNRLAGF